MEAAVSAQQEKFAKSGLGTYREFVVGDSSLPYWIGYEVSQLLLANLSGLPGFALRSLVYPWLFKSCGKRPAIGRGVQLRNPTKIEVGNKLLIDDYAVLDVRGKDASISLGDMVSIGRFTTVSAKFGRVSLAAGANIGSYCRLATQSNLEIGESVLIAAYCYIGPGNHQQGDDQTPLIKRAMEIKGGVKIGAHAWIGTRATILDGVTIGERAIVGAHSLVVEDVPAGAVVAGTPARILKHG